MLIIDSDAMEKIRIRRAEAYVMRLLAELTREFPTLLTPLPNFVQMTMIGNGLDHAGEWGFTLESTMARFVALQCATAADFFQHPDVRAVLERASDGEQSRMDRLVRDVPQAAWDLTLRGVDIRAWFEPQRPEQRSARIAARVCATFPELVQSTPEPALRALFDASIPSAAMHGIVPESGVCVFAAALALYSDKLDRHDGPDWAQKIFVKPSPPLGAEKIVALLRLAISLDTNRMI